MTRNKSNRAGETVSRLRRATRRTAAVMAVGLSASLAAPVVSKAFQKDAEPQKASVRVSVVGVDPSRQPPTYPVESATVKIKGEEDSYETDMDGRTRTVVILPGQKAIIVRPSGADPCNVDVVSKEGSQTVTVLVEMSPKIKCTLQPQ